MPTWYINGSRVNITRMSRLGCPEGYQSHRITRGPSKGHVKCRKKTASGYVYTDDTSHSIGEQLTKAKQYPESIFRPKQSKARRQSDARRSRSVQREWWALVKNEMKPWSKPNTNMIFQANHIANAVDIPPHPKAARLADDIVRYRDTQDINNLKPSKGVDPRMARHVIEKIATSRQPRRIKYKAIANLIQTWFKTPKDARTAAGRW